MMKKFNRPATLSYPTVYYKFKALDSDGKTTVEYRIQDFPRDRHDEGVKFMIDYFVEEVPTFKSRDIGCDEIALIEGSRIWKSILDENISIACFKEGCNDIISINLLTVKTLYDDDSEEGDEDQKIHSRDLNDIVNLHQSLEKQFNPFKHYNVDAYLYAMGLAVHPAYRGRGIATEMFKVRPLLLRALGLKVATSHFIGIGGQNAAAKACYEENMVISYDDLYKINSNYYFSGVESESVKIMSLSLE